MTRPIFWPRSSCVSGGKPRFNLYSLVVSVIGAAIIVLVIYHAIAGRRVP